MTSKLRPTTGAVIMLLCFGVFELTLLALVVYLATSFIEPIQIITTGGTEVFLNVFQAIPMMLVIGWVGFMIGYYAWCTYFYNFNYGRSDSFWKSFVDRVNEEKQKPDGVNENDLYEVMGAPRKNPYSEETFGFPPGTVRGSLALTIVVGGLALLIASFGGDSFFSIASAAAIGNYFDFFRDAFLMVVAFYFGTKGLDIIQKEQTRREEALREAQAKAGVSMRLPALETASLAPQTVAPFGLRTPTGSTREAVKAAASKASAMPSSPVSSTLASSSIASTETESMQEKQGEEREKQVTADFPHIQDLQAEHSVKEARKLELEPIDFADFARDYNMEEAIVRAVCEVEAAGSGFFKDGRPKILFEGHVFWKQLKKYGVDPEPFAAQERFQPVLYSKWTRKHYKGGPAEYDRLALAREIHDDAALCSASWGLFQIMGYHFDRLEYANVQEYVRANEESAGRHLEAFGRYIKAYNLDDFLRRKEWANFAKRYNGPGYRENRYDEKLEKAYQKFKKAEVAIIEHDLNQPADVPSSSQSAHAEHT